MIDLEKLEKEEIVARWQRHRMFCLKLAAKLGAASPEQAIEMAEALGVYILNGRPAALKEATTADERGLV